MKVIEIIQAHLVANGFDGLASDECGCKLRDLQPCGEDFSQCKPGYKHQLPDGDWEIRTERTP